MSFRSRTDDKQPQVVALECIHNNVSIRSQRTTSFSESLGQSSSKIVNHARQLRNTQNGCSFALYFKYEARKRSKLDTNTTPRRSSKFPSFLSRVNVPSKDLSEFFISYFERQSLNNERSAKGISIQYEHQSFEFRKKRFRKQRRMA